MANIQKPVNIVIYDGEELINLTGDTVSKDTLLAGRKAHDRSGNIITGECTFDSDTKDANATPGEIIDGKTAYVAGEKVTGSMPNVGTQNATITSLNQEVNIATGFHNGSGKVTIDATQKDVIKPENIKGGVTILGVEGTYSPTEVNPQANKDAVPTADGFEVLPDSGYDYLAKVTVKPIPLQVSLNEQGGYTVTIA